ncbi:hypothetical protein Leryth_018339, partial [Lithospermum erythrorhizon]
MIIIRVPPSTENCKCFPDRRLQRSSLIRVVDEDVIQGLFKETRKTNKRNSGRKLHSLTLVPRKDTRGRRAARTIPFSPTVTATLRNVPPLPQLGQKIFPTSV